MVEIHASSSEMIERLARALFDEFYRLEEHPSWILVDVHQRWFRMARIALEQVRNPTDAMMIAAAKAHPNLNHPVVYWVDRPGDWTPGIVVEFQAAIDAALDATRVESAVKTDAKRD